MNFGFVIDNRKCIGCHACTVACKAEHDVAIGVNRTWVKYIEKGEFPNSRRIFSVMRCNHCEDAPCVEICPVSALFIRDDGIVDFDNRRCIGCKACTQACPYDALYIDPNSHTAAKCNYCAHRVDIGLEPACVNVCPEHAIISGDMDDPASEISLLIAQEQVQVRKPEKGTRPKLYYIDGDEASITPTAAEPSQEYMWSKQSAGVGHYAAAVGRIHPERIVAMAEDFQIPQNGDSRKIREKAAEVVKENARRVYDAPSKGVMWGWEVYSYILTKAIAVGAFFVPFFIQLSGIAPIPDAIQIASVITGLVFLGLTGLLLVIDLDKPGRFLYVLLRPHWTSWLVRGAYIISGYGLLLTLWLVARLLKAENVLEPLAIAALVLAFFTAIYTAFLFGQARGRDFWQSPMLSLHMFSHALTGGAALFAVLAFFWGLVIPLLWIFKLVLVAGISFHLISMLAESLTPHPTADVEKVSYLITRGPFRYQFWLGVAILGNVLPLILLLTVSSVAVLALSAAMVLLGLWFSVRLWVIVPQTIPLS